jgi:PAB1-binding protein PBP1
MEPLIDSIDSVSTKSLASTRRVYNEDSGFGDDEELQELLAQRRRQALKKRKYSHAEDIARSIKASVTDDDIRATEHAGLVIDDTSEFVRGLEMSRLEAATSRDDAHIAEQSHGRMEVDEAIATSDVDMPDVTVVKEKSADESADNTAILVDEPIIAGSLAATLAALKRTGNKNRRIWVSDFRGDCRGQEFEQFLKCRP